MVRLNDHQINKKLEWVHEYLDHTKNAADASKVDANANVEVKNVASMYAEFNKDVNIQIHRKVIYDELVSLFDEATAKEYIRQLEDHEIYCHDETQPFFPYCVAIDSTPFLYNGLKMFGNGSSAPQHLHSYCGSYLNLLFIIGSQFSGAVADVSFLKDFHYFAKKDYGADYLNTNAKDINDFLEQVVYTLNTPAASRGFQSIFYNTSVFDKFYFEGLYSYAYYPNGDKVIDEWEGINRLQKHFLTWFNKERERSLLTFPVITAALKLKEDGSLEDRDWRSFVAKEFSEGNSFFIYMDKNVSSLSSCCFEGNQKVLTKSSNGVSLLTFKELSESPPEETKKNFTVFHNGSWVKGKVVKTRASSLIRIRTANKKEMTTTTDHLWPTLDGDKRTEDLTTKDYIMFNTLPLETDSLEDQNLTYKEGFDFGISLGRGDSGEELTLSCLLQTKDFRLGILDGYCYARGEYEEISTKSLEKAESIEALITSLGFNSCIDTSPKEGQVKYCIHWYSPKNERSMKNTYIVKNNSIYFKVDSVKRLDDKDQDVFCFEMENELEPYFTLPNGAITHNCRLRNDISDQMHHKNTFSYSMSNTGISTGSKRVITLNLNRLVQEKHRDLRTEVQKIHKYLLAHESWLRKLKNQGLLPVYDAGFIAFEKQYLTVGLSGIVEAAEFLGKTIDYNPDYVSFIQDTLRTITVENKRSSEELSKKTGWKIMINSEFVPGENLSSKFFDWDKKAGFKVPDLETRNLYNSYFYPVEADLDMTDKILLHGHETLQYLDGGSALHLNLEEHLPKEGFELLLDHTARLGTNYWTYNVLTTLCSDCGHIDKKTLDICPRCHSSNIEYATRVIGFLKKVSSFSKARKIEASRRKYHEIEKEA